MPDVHSEYAPSSLGDKMKCPGRHLATLGMDGGSSPDADRGTECHDWAEVLLPAYLEGYAIDKPDFVEAWQEDCTEEMVSHAVDKYNEMSLLGPVEYHTEMQVSLQGLAEDNFDLAQVFGTCDVFLVCRESETLSIIDYKTGIGVKVAPEHNTQLMIYALGSLATLGLLGSVNKVDICISQPRVNSELQVWSTTVDELYQWLHMALIPALEAMSKPDAPFTPGEAQCRWCPISGKCKAQRDDLLGMFDTAPDADSTPTLSAEEVGALMLRVSEFRQWINQVESAGINLMQDGQSVPDFKLIRGGSNRKWTDLEAAEKFLLSQKLTQKERFTYKLLSPAQAETKLKDNLKRTVTLNNFKKLVTKPEGKITYARKDDPREEYVVNKVADLIELKDLL